MRISDWSSDVCSSDLELSSDLGQVPRRVGEGRLLAARVGDRGEESGPGRVAPVEGLRPAEWPAPVRRSEEHTSELQSLMRISYAVFCLKKKKQTLQRVQIEKEVRQREVPQLYS